MSAASTERPGCLGFLISKIRSLLGFSSEKPAALPYRLRDDFLSPAELSFYRVLVPAAGPGVTVCPKVRLADVLFVTRPSENRSYLNRIIAKHIDFVLCDSSTMQPILVVELDDASHQRSRRQERDAFLDRAVAAAKLPILRVRAQQDYAVGALADQLRPLLTPPSQPQGSPAAVVASGREAEAPRPSAAGPPNCPNCGEPMVVRVASKGKNRGRRFYGCVNFPQCRNVLPLNATGIPG